MYPMIWNTKWVMSNFHVCILHILNKRCSKFVEFEANCSGLVQEMRLFVCLGLTSLWNIWGHIMTVPACSSGTLTNVPPHRNAMPQTQDTTPHPVTVFRHGADLSLCYPLMWNVTLEYTATHFNVLGETQPGNPSPTFHTHQRTLNLMLSWWSTVGSSVESIVPTGSWTRDLWCANPVRYPLAHSDFLNEVVKIGYNRTVLIYLWKQPFLK